MPAYLKASIRMLAACIVLYCATGVRASTFILPTDDDLIISARAIVRGKVLSISCQFDEQTGRIFTYVRLRVSEVLKGQITTKHIVLKQEGGRVGDRGSTVFGSPQFARREKVLLYLDSWSDGSLRVHQMFLGKFRIEPDELTGRSFVNRDIPDSETTLIDSALLSQRQRSATSRAELSVYAAMVRTTLTENWERAVEFEKKYGNAPIVSQPLEYSPSSGEVEPRFTLIFNPPPRWLEPDTGLPVVFEVNPDGAPPQIMDDVAAAMNAWSTVPGSTMRVVNGGPTDRCDNGQGTLIQFNNCDGRWGAGADCSGILALGGISWDNRVTRQVNGTTFVKATSAFVSFNPYASCSFADRCNVREIATHELGHALGLGHTIEPTGTMHATAHFDGRCASLKQDDVDAITYVYPVQDLGSRPLTISTDTLPIGIVQAAYATTVFSATGGARPYRWNLAPGQGRLPSGLLFNSGGLIGGTPLDTGTFNFVVQLTDGNGASVTKPFSIRVITPAGPYDSEFSSQSVPSTVLLNQSFTVTLKFINLGSQPWNDSTGLTLRSQNPAGNTSWGSSALPITGVVVAPGKHIELTFSAVAPGSFGTYSFQWQLYQDSVGFFGQASVSISVRVTDGSSPPVIGSPSIVDGVIGVAFNYQLAVSAGSSPFSWSLAGGALPGGLTLNSNGTISGTAAATGSSTATLQVTDAQSRTAQKAITFNVTLPPLAVATVSIPQAQRGSPFTHQLAAIGGKPPYTWAVTGGALPSGLGLSAASGIISGTPNAIGSFNFTAAVTDSESKSAGRPLTIAVVPPPLSIASVPVIDAVKDQPFSYQLTANGGTPAYSWSVTSGTLPSGLGLNSGSGLITGVPTVAGQFASSVAVRDQASVVAITPVQIRVLDPETIPSIRKVKYKGRKKLIVRGDRIHAQAVLLVNGNQISYRVDEGSLIVKPLALAAGRHEVKIVNPGVISSQTYVLTVE